MADVSQRKADHIALCAHGDVGFRHQTTLLEKVRLVHDALPELAQDEVDLHCDLLGKRLRAPIVIAGMTGGTPEAARLNRQLAGFAESRGYGFCVGSQRAMHVRPESRDTYQVRDEAPSTLVLGNLGLVQARQMPTSDVAALAGAIGADALCIHLNPAMELIQPGGDRDFRDGLATIARLVAELPIPVVVKETGCGISRSVGERVKAVGIHTIDVSGAGGTSWVGVETRRAEEAGDGLAREVGETFWDWGIPTAASVGMLAPLGFTLIATGGISSGLDVARAIVLGARACGLARPALQAALAGRLADLFDRVEAELRAAMLLTGSRTLADLAKAPRILTGELAIWLAREGAS
jgi:isopentenyl-diphosphate delta-isomerase